MVPPVPKVVILGRVALTGVVRSYSIALGTCHDNGDAAAIAANAKQTRAAILNNGCLTTTDLESSQRQTSFLVDISIVARTNDIGRIRDRPFILS